MTSAQLMIEAFHWGAIVSFVASVLLHIIPPPTEIPGNRYLIFYNTVRRIAINSAWTPHGEPATESRVDPEPLVLATPDKPKGEK